MEVDMNVQPIQVTKEGVLIPREYLSGASEFELELTNDHLLIRPKVNGQPSVKEEKPRYSWIGIGHSGNPNASVEVEEILAKEIDRRSGWTLKPPLEEEDAS